MTFDEHLKGMYNEYLRYTGVFINNKSHAADVLADIILYMYEKYGRERLDDICANQNISALLKRIIYVQTTSSASNALHRKYRCGNYSQFDDVEELPAEEEDFELVAPEGIRKLLDEYKNNGMYGEVRLFELYFLDGHTYRVIEDLVGIPYSVVFLTVRQVKRMILNDINKTLSGI